MDQYLSEKFSVPVLLANEFLQVEVLPEFGGKISSIVELASATEMLQPQLRPVVPRLAGLAFDRSDASGWDECLPTVAACTLPGGATMQDHGDLWREPWTVLTEDATSVQMSVLATSLPLHLSRTLRLEGRSLLLDYQLSNVGDRPAEYVWSAHPLFAVEAGDRIVLPPDTSEVLVEGSGRGRLGAGGSRVPWPGPIELDHVLAPDADVGDKLYAAAPAEGWAALERVRSGLRLEVVFDPAVLPWLGLWICYGGWPERAATRGYCVALEPCTAPADSLARAIKEGHARTLAPDEAHTWRIEVRIVAL